VDRQCTHKLWNADLRCGFSTKTFSASTEALPFDNNTVNWTAAHFS